MGEAPRLQKSPVEQAAPPGIFVEVAKHARKLWNLCTDVEQARWESTARSSTWHSPPKRYICLQKKGPGEWLLFRAWAEDTGTEAGWQRLQERNDKIGVYPDHVAALKAAETYLKAQDVERALGKVAQQS